MVASRCCKENELPHSGRAKANARKKTNQKKAPAFTRKEVAAVVSVCVEASTPRRALSLF